VIKQNKNMKWAGHLAHRGKRNAHNIFTGKHQNSPLGKIILNVFDDGVL
jgi:hypothetical protein